MSSSKQHPPAPPRQEMIDAVAEAIREFEKFAADPELVGACPELPGVVLDRVMGRAIDRKGEEYLVTIKDYDNIRNEYFQALVNHPIGRTLALLAVGAEGLKIMEAGRSPSTPVDT